MTAKELADILANEKITQFGGTITITGPAPLGELGVGECRRCGQCVHFCVYKPGKAVNPEGRDYGGWCEKMRVTTAPELLRCGGDDFVRRNR